jgi:hypothetical protein
MQRARRAIRAVRSLAREDRIPKPLRGLVVVGLLPIPGPFDEAVLLVAAGILYGFYRDEMVEAWREAEAPRRESIPG